MRDFAIALDYICRNPRQEFRPDATLQTVLSPLWCIECNTGDQGMENSIPAAWLQEPRKCMSNGTLKWGILKERGSLGCRSEVGRMSLFLLAAQEQSPRGLRRHDRPRHGLALGHANDGEARTRPMQYTAILIAAVGLALSCLACNRPTPVPPLQASGFLTGPKVVELSADYRIRNLLGAQAIVAYPGWRALWQVDLHTGETRRLASDELYKEWNAVSADYATKTVNRLSMQVPGEGRPTREGNDVFLLNLHTGAKRRITQEPAERRNLQISGTHLVWQERRNESAAQDFQSTIYAYDIETRETILIAEVENGRFSRSSAISGNMIVWADNRHSPWTETSKADRSHRPLHRFDLYAYDLSTREEKPLVVPGFLNGAPSIHGQRVVWQQFREHGGSDIQLLNLDTGRMQTVGPGGIHSAPPEISGDYVVWTVRQACDAVSNYGRSLRSGTFAYNLQTGTTRKLTSYIEPVAQLHDKVVLIHEGCGPHRRLYAVWLD